MDTIEKLQNLGFTNYEARAYLALLTVEPATAYETAKASGIPTSKIYETVRKLIERGVMLESQGEGNNRLLNALPPDALMATIRYSAVLETRALQEELEKLPGSPDRNLVWSVHRHEDVQAKALAIIESATENLLLSLWPEELAWCEQALRVAEARGIKIALVHFGKPNISIGATYHHPVERTLYTEKGGRGLTLVADGREVIIATFRPGGDVDGAWSTNESFVTVAEDYVKHDVYITKVTRFLNAEMIQRFGEDYVRLRDVFDAEA